MKRRVPVFATIAAIMTVCLGTLSRADEFVIGNLDPDVEALEQGQTETEDYESLVRYNLMDEYGLTEEDLADIDVVDFYLSGGLTEREYTKEEVKKKLEEYREGRAVDDMDMFFGDVTEKYEGDFSDAVTVGVKRMVGTDSVILLFDMKNGRILKRTEGYWSYRDDRYAFSEESRERLVQILKDSGILDGETSIVSGNEGDGTDTGYILAVKTDKKVYRYSCLAHSGESVPESVSEAETGIRTLLDDIVHMTMLDYIELETEN